ncbi:MULTISPECIES: BglG family transcription antiterminator LicT [Clostridium]|uniref:Transcription antiterminator n=1 Tax=Clostridium disporicum TaxID=84024 RepID=A0A174E9E7_9CLOT|nr:MULTISPECIES: PRD domain-containing protein [Clostridium]CUO32925.1 transcription antiterminator [Clostridium disporicum]
MIVEKVLNNNVVVSIDPKTKKEVILMGSGIAFNKKPGQQIDEKKIEKTFVVDDENLGNKIKKLINQIPEGIFEITDEIITHAIVELNTVLDKQIYVSLADHIAFAVKRFRSGIIIKNELLNEVRRVHKAEFKVSLWAVDYINEKLGIELPEDEAGFIALHFVNAGYRETTMKSITSTKIIKDILNIIKYNFAIELDEDDLNYDRLLTHLKYFAKRIVNNNQSNSTDSGFIKMISTTYPEAYECAVKIGDYILKNNDYYVNDDEIVYLTMHIQRVITVARENNINMDK